MTGIHLAAAMKTVISDSLSRSLVTERDCQEVDSRQFKAWNKNQGEGGAGWGLGGRYGLGMA